MPRKKLLSFREAQAIKKVSRTAMYNAIHRNVVDAETTTAANGRLVVIGIVDNKKFHSWKPLRIHQNMGKRKKRK